MCSERWMRRQRRREERRFDEEIRYLIDEGRASREPQAPVMEHERPKESRDPERVRVEAGARS
jgi:hypothetical protein